MSKAKSSTRLQFNCRLPAETVRTIKRFRPKHGSQADVIIGWAEAAERLFLAQKHYTQATNTNSTLPVLR